MYRFAVLVLAGVAGAAGAQDDARRDPSVPGAQVPKFEYRSAFSDYRPFSEEKVAPWREVNDEVGRVGGHAGHSGQQKPAPAKPGAAAPAAPKAPPDGPAGGHGGHR